MPQSTVPDERMLKDKRSVTAEGIECEVFVYKEEGSVLFDSFPWTQWHVRLEVPIHGYGRQNGRKLFHERVDTESAVDGAIKQLKHRAEHYIEKRITDKGRVLV